MFISLKITEKIDEKYWKIIISSWNWVKIWEKSNKNEKTDQKSRKHDENMWKMIKNYQKLSKTHWKIRETATKKIENAENLSKTQKFN